MEVAVDLGKLDKQVRFLCRTNLKKVWDNYYGLSDEDVGNIAHVAVLIYYAQANMAAAICIDRALDIAFEERNKLYEERM
jgi:hypothetical protein